MIKIVIIDDHTLFRIGLIAILKKESTFEILGEYDSFSAVKSSISTLNANLVLVDISLGDENGLEIVKYIKDIRPGIKIIALSMHKKEFYVMNAMEAGVDGYIHKDSSPEDLIMGIKKVFLGEKFYSSDISSILINNIYHKSYGKATSLTSKEKEIVNFLTEGYSSKEIAAKLSISPRTVDTHRANILGKFGLKNTSELIKNIVEQKIRF